MTAGRALRLLGAETKYEFLTRVRLPAFAIPTIGFPLMFYSIFGLAFSARANGTAAAAYLIATMGTFGVIGAALFGLGVGVALDRGQGWMTVKRASPMPVGVYFGARVLTAMLFAVVIVVLLFALGYTFGGVRLAAPQWFGLAASLVFGAAPFCALGIAIGYVAGPNSAPGIVNILYLPMAFASGLWMPLQMLPKFINQLAPMLPPYHLAQLALTSAGLSPDSAMKHIVVLIAFAAAFLMLAAFGFARDEGKTYG